MRELWRQLGSPRHLVVFEAATRLSSFTRAARELSVQWSTGKGFFLVWSATHPLTNEAIQVRDWILSQRDAPDN